MSQWTPAKLGKLWFCFLDKLIAFLLCGILPNYFIPECNLLSPVQGVGLPHWVVTLLNVRVNPLQGFYQFYKTNSFGTVHHMNWAVYMQKTFKFISHTGARDDASTALILMQTMNYLLCVRNTTDIIRLLNAFPDFSIKCWQEKFDPKSVSKLLLVAYGKTFENEVKYTHKTGEKDYILRYVPHLTEMGTIAYKQSFECGNNIEEKQKCLLNAEEYFLKATATLKDADRPASNDIEKRIVTKAYGNFLLSSGRYEKAIGVLISILNEPLVNQKMYLTQHLAETYDECLCAELSGDDTVEKEANVQEYCCRMLIICYMKARVFAEVYIPSIQKNLQHTMGSGMLNSFFTKVTRMTKKGHFLFASQISVEYLIYQYIAAGYYQLAAECLIPTLRAGWLAMPEQYQWSFSVFRYLMARFFTCNLLN